MYESLGFDLAELDADMEGAGMCARGMYVTPVVHAIFEVYSSPWPDSPSHASAQRSGRVGSKVEARTSNLAGSPPLKIFNTFYQARV